NICIASDLETELLDEIYTYLYLVARKSGAHIDPLHKHLLRRRTVVVTENPKLHLVRHYRTIYVKPLPDYLLNHQVWQDHGSRLQVTHKRYDKRRASLGFLRSYSLLIRHESDFIIAHKSNLLPRHVSFYRFQKFIRPFRSILDEDVSHRYHFGQSRLTRLNWAVRIIRVVQVVFPFTFNNYRFPVSHKDENWQIAEYIQKYAAPLVFVFGTLSLILSSM
ncbi:hypothetical protein M406DRAFT_232761, partial [Cryphonectria parasitica EP155]